MDELTQVIAEALADDTALTEAEWLDAEKASARIAAALAPLIVARAWEAYLEGVRHGSDELDPEEFSDDIPAAVKAAIEARVREAQADALEDPLPERISRDLATQQAYDAPRAEGDET